MSGGSSGGGGSSNSDKTESFTPWKPAQDGLKYGASENDRLYNLGPQQYTPWGQVAGFDPMQSGALRGLSDYVSNNPGTAGLDAVQGLMNSNAAGGQMSRTAQGVQQGYVGDNSLADTSQAMNQLAYGDNSNPYLQSKLQGQLQGLADQFTQSQLPGMRRAANGNGTYGSTRNDIAEGMAAASLNNQMNQASSDAYQNDYNTSEANRLQALNMLGQQAQFKNNLATNVANSAADLDYQNQALGLSQFANQLNVPLSQLDALMNAGQLEQQQNQNQLNDSTNRWNFDQNAQWDNLNNYINNLREAGGVGGSSGSSQQQVQPLIPMSTTGNILGGALSLGGLGLGLYNSYSSGGGNPVQSAGSFQITPSLASNTGFVGPKFQSGNY